MFVAASGQAFLSASNITDADAIQREEQGRDGEARRRSQKQREESARSAGAAAGLNTPKTKS